MRALWLTVLLGGCLAEMPPEDPGTSQRGACTALEGTTFRSVEQGECGLTPNGVAYCTWTLSFTSEDGTRSRYAWSHSDVGESGTATCDGVAIRSDSTGQPYEGMFDGSSLDVVWDGRAYAAAP